MLVLLLMSQALQLNSSLQSSSSCSRKDPTLRVPLGPGGMLPQATMPGVLMDAGIAGAGDQPSPRW